MFGCCGYSTGYTPNYGKTYGTILVLFILLVIIGCTCYSGGGHYKDC